MEPTTIMAAASVAQGVMGFKGNRAAARSARQVAEYNAQVQENELVLLQRQKRDDEANLRRQSGRLMATQRVATAASGIQMTGSPRQALADTYFNTELDALRIQYAADIAETQKLSEAAMTRIAGRAQASAYNTAAFSSLLTMAGGVAQARQQEQILGQQREMFELEQARMTRELGR